MITEINLKTHSSEDFLEILGQQMVRILKAEARVSEVKKRLQIAE